jgi:glutathione synthase/RimK-type ligase-like ATP-grasp enzyme
MRNVLLCASKEFLGASRLPRLFAAAGCSVAVLSRDWLSMNSSRYVGQRIRTAWSPEDVRHGLEEHIAKFLDKYDLIVLTDEPLMRTFLDRPASPELASRLPLVADSTRLEQMLSKAKSSEKMRAAGIPVPDFRVVRGRNETIRKEWREPFVVKMDESFNGLGVRIVKSAEEQSALDEVLEARPIVLQRYVAGPVGTTSVLYEHGVPKCWFSCLVRRTWPSAVSASTALQPFWRSEIESILTRLGEITGFHGLCGVDWVVDARRGSLYVLEMNARPTPGLHVSPIAGVCFSRAIAEMLNGNASVQRPADTPGGLYRLFPQNLFPAIADRNFSEFLRTWQDAPWTDPMLLLHQFRFVAMRQLPPQWQAELGHAARRVKAAFSARSPHP